MTFNFTDSFPAELNLSSILISGGHSLSFNGLAYLVVEDEQASKRLFEIRYQYHWHSSKEVLIVDKLLAVGFEDHFYLFDLHSGKSLLALEVGGYFGQLYYDANYFYIAHAFGVYCIEKTGSIRWHNGGLAIDGVIIEEFTADTVAGSGEMDPPGGWQDFILDKQTGVQLS